MMMLRVIVLASAFALADAAPSTTRTLVGRELGNRRGRDDCDGKKPSRQSKCYKGATDSILSLPRTDAASICQRTEDPGSGEESGSGEDPITCSGCLECQERPSNPRANEGNRTFSTKTTFPYWDDSVPGQQSAGPCCDWCDNEKHEGKAWKRAVGQDPDVAKPPR